VGLPAVLKPVTGMGSLAVFRVMSFAELQRAYEEGIRQYESDRRVAGRRASFLLERELPGRRWHADPRVGDYVAVDSLVGGGTIAHLAVQDKLPLAYPYRETGHILPSTLPERQQCELLEVTERCVESIGVTVGAVQVEIKLTEDGPRVLEVNGRCGGAIPYMMEDAFAYNQVAEMARLAMGDVPRRPPESHRYAAYLTPQAPARHVRISQVPSLDELLTLPGVVSADVIVRVGAEPNWRTGTNANLARVEAVADTWYELVGLGEFLGSSQLFKHEVLSEGAAAGSTAANT
jgi:biotin carboxylase